MSLSNLFEGNHFNLYTSTLDGKGSLTIGKNPLTTELHLGDTGTPVYINEQLYTGGGGASLAVGAIGSSSNTNGISLTGNILNLQPANASFGGVLTNGTQTFGGVKTLANGLKLTNGTVNYTAGTLDYYEEATVNTTASGPWTGIAITLKFVRVGKMVTMQFSQIDLAVVVSGQYISVDSLIPTRFYPSALVSYPVEVINGVNNASYNAGVLQINSGAIIILGSATRGMFSSTYAGVNGGSISYITA